MIRHVALNFQQRATPVFTQSLSRGDLDQDLRFAIASRLRLRPERDLWIEIETETQVWPLYRDWDLSMIFVSRLGHEHYLCIKTETLTRAWPLYRDWDRDLSVTFVSRLRPEHYLCINTETKTRAWPFFFFFSSSSSSLSVHPYLPRLRHIPLAIASAGMRLRPENDLCIETETGTNTVPSDH